MTAIESINRDLAELDNKSPVKAASFIRALLPKPALQKRANAIKALHGCLESEEHDSFEAPVLGTEAELSESK